MSTQKILNPFIWKDNILRQEVKDALDNIVIQFIDELETNNIPIDIVDVHIVGSNASYNYDLTSDLDVHIVADFSNINCNEKVLELLYNFFKSYFNNKYNISVHGIKVELYIENQKTPAKSNGIYSLVDDEWIKFPEQTDVIEVDIEQELSSWLEEYNKIIASSNIELLQDFLNRLYIFRRDSLINEGEYGKGNLVFKYFRNNGYIDTIKDLLTQNISQNLTLEAVNEMLKENAGFGYHYGDFGKEAGKKITSIKLSSTPKSTLDAPNVINEIIRGDKYSLADDWDLWQGGGYEYKDLEPQTREFMNNHLQYTTKSLSRIEMPAYSTKNNTLEIGGIINMGPPRSFSRSIQGTVDILRSDDWDPEESCILRTTGKVQYFDSKYINNDSRGTFAYQEEVLCGGVFEVVDKTSLIVDNNEYVVYVIKQIRTPKWTYNVNESLDMKSIQDYVEDNFSFKTTPPEGQMYIMSDGRFLELGYDGAHIGVDDMLYQDNLIDYDPYDYGHELILVDKFNAVRCSDGKAINANPYIQLPPNKITQAQLDAIMNWLYGLDEDVVYVEGVEYNLNEVTVDYVIKRILRYYSSGVMYEDYLDPDEQFWDYKTEKVSGKDIFDTNNGSVIYDLKEAHQDQTVYTAISRYEDFVYKYGKNSALFELKYKYHLTDEELVYIINRLSKKGLMDEYTKVYNISALGLEEYFK